MAVRQECRRQSDRVVAGSSDAQTADYNRKRKTVSIFLFMEHRRSEKWS
jgi:hypothetical protein